MSEPTKAEHQLSRLYNNEEINKRALDMATSIVHKYSDITMTETCCSAQDLLTDISKQFVRLMYDLEKTEKHHEAWMQWQRLYFMDKKPSLLQRIFS